MIANAIDSQLRRLVPVAVILGLYLAMSAPAANAQEAPEANLAAMYNRTLMYLNAGKYEEGLDLVNRVIRYWGKNAGDVVGPGYGHFYYLKGLLHMGREEYQSAIDAFQTCYEDFPNDILNRDGQASKTKLLNRFRVHSLAQWGICLMMSSDYAGAIDMFKRTLKENTEGRVRSDIIGINLGRSYLRNGDLKEGKELLTKALTSEKVNLDMKRGAFMVLAEDWSREVDFTEVQALVWEYGYLVRQDSRTNRWRRNGVFSFLARNALESYDPLRALLWYGMLLNPQELVAHNEEKLKSLKTIPVQDDRHAASLQAQIDELEESSKNARDNLSAMLLGVGSGHYQLKNFTGAYAAFDYLIEAFPEHPKRPETLYNLIASCVQLFLWKEVRSHGWTFLREYPEHDLMPEVARMMVESIFMLEEYQEAYDTATDIRRVMEVGSVARDVPDFVTGASAYHLESYLEAETELDAYLKNYPEPRREEAGRYYLGSTKVKLYKWLEGAEILEAFMADYPKSELYSSALYQAALCRYVLGEFEDALTKTLRLIEEFPNSLELAAAHNLKGDIFTALGDVPFEDIREAYLTGKEISDRNPILAETAAYSLWKLMILHDGVQDWEQVTAYYDEFKATHAGSQHELDALAASLTALAQTGRAAEAESTLETFILRHANETTTPHLSELFGSYFSFLGDQYSPDEGIAKLRHFPTPSPAPEPLKAWLAVGEIDMLEAREGDAYQEAIQQLYYDIQLGLERKNTPNYALVKLARWNRAQSHFERARELYDFVIEHQPDGGHLELALLDLAQMDALSDDSLLLDASLENFKRVRLEFQPPDLLEDATLGGARVLTRQKNYAEAKDWWQDYLSHRSWMQARPEANFQMGRCVEELGQPKEALKIYVSVYANFPGHLDWSTQAYLRTAEILRASGNESDSLLVLVDMLKRMGHLEHPGINEARAKFQNWREEWVQKQ